MQVYKFYPNLMKFRKFSMTPSLSGNYRQDVILPLKLDCMESSKTLSKPLPYAAVCMKNAFQNCSTDILRYSIRSLKSELLKSIFWPWKYIFCIEIDLEYLYIHKITFQTKIFNLWDFISFPQNYTVLKNTTFT